MTDQSNKPLDRMQEGSIHASFFLNRGQNGDYVSTNIRRVYKDRQTGEFKETSSFSGAELLQLRELAERAYHRERELKDQLRQIQGHAAGQPQSGPNIEGAKKAMEAASNGVDQSISDDQGHDL